MQTIPPYEEPEPLPESQQWHPIATVTLGQLIENNFVEWDSKEWRWDAYNEEQYKRVCNKFNDHFYWREIGVLPLQRFRWEVRRKFNEQMPKYKPFYEALDKGNTPLQTQETYGKSRNIYSDFPATQLQPETQDYATNANDSQHDTVTNGDWMEKTEKLKTYNDIDLMLINDMEELFSCLLSVNVNL